MLEIQATHKLFLYWYLGNMKENFSTFLWLQLIGPASKHRLTFLIQDWKLHPVPILLTEDTPFLIWVLISQNNFSPKPFCNCSWLKRILDLHLNTFCATGLFRYTLKTLENLKINYKDTRKPRLGGGYKFRWKKFDVNLSEKQRISAHFCVSYRNQSFDLHNRMTDFYMEYNTELKWIKKCDYVNLFLPNVSFWSS